MDIDSILDSVRKLPPAPQILPKLQKLLGDANSSMVDIAGLIKLDANLAAQVIRVSNSSYYGASQACQTVEDAVNRIGFQDVHKIVGAVATRDIFGEALPLYHMEAGDLWELSIRVGTVMHALAYHLDEDPDTAYTIGLLHGIGIVILSHYTADYGIEALNQHDGEEPLTPEAERELLGFDHAALGAALLLRWKFPREIFQPIQCQYMAMEAKSSLRLACLLSLTKLAIQQLDAEAEDLYDTFYPDPEELEQVGFDPETLISAALDSESTFEWLANSL